MRRGLGRAAASLGVALLALGASNAPAGATSTYGTLGNFDAVNDTGKEAHGFEIDLEGISVSDVTDVFGGVGRYFPPSVERYGAPTITENAHGTGVIIRYEATFNITTKSWNVGTPSGVLATSGESCWTGGGGGYGPGTPCDHFGVGTKKTPTGTTYSWLTETAPNSPVLNNVSPSLPAPVQIVTPAPPPPPGQPAQPPKVQGIVEAPAPDGGAAFGIAEWVKVFTIQYDHPVALEDLVGGKHGLAPQNPSETEVEWQLLQSEVGNPAAGMLESGDQQAGAGAESVLRRYEFYKYAGQYEGLNGVPTFVFDGSQALTDTAITGPGGNVGSFIGDQNLGVNLNGVYVGPPVAGVPEPSTWTIMLIGFAGLGFAGRRAVRATG